MADLVVVSTGPLHLSAGALAWAQAADSTIVVAARDQARRDDVEYAAESLKLVGVDKAGTILVERKRAIRRVRPTAAPSEGSRPIVREPIREPVRQMYRELRPEPRPELRFEPLREPYREPSPQPYREPTPEPIREPSPEPLREPSPEPFREPSPEPFREPSPEPYRIVRDDVDEPLELDQRPPRPEPKSPTRRTPRRRGQPDRPSA
jgi:hypothetical protein